MTFAGTTEPDAAGPPVFLGSRGGPHRISQLTARAIAGAESEAPSGKLLRLGPLSSILAEKELVMPILSTTLHLDMLNDFTRGNNRLPARLFRAIKHELAESPIYGLQWGDRKPPIPCVSFWIGMFAHISDPTTPRSRSARAAGAGRDSPGFQ
jgi:hypothetical protein